MSAVAKAAGIPHVCDSTFATPLMIKPLDLGADMTLQVGENALAKIGVCSAHLAGLPPECVYVLLHRANTPKANRTGLAKQMTNPSD